MSGLSPMSSSSNRMIWKLGFSKPLGPVFMRWWRAKGRGADGKTGMRLPIR